jgi:protocatechuate 3,4-dioxygenase beta subunit
MFTTCSLLVTLSLAQAPAAAEPGRIVGRVTVAGTGAPVAGARVMLIAAAPPHAPLDRPPAAITDQDGRYTFNRVASGTYYLHIDKAGFAPLLEPETPRSASLQLAPGQRLDGVDRQLQRGAVITGRVVDSHGEPVPGVGVTAMQRIALPGIPVLQGRPAPLFPAPGQMHTTNDIGEFRVADLAAGEYVVAAMQGRPMMFGAPQPARDAHTTFVLTFYPGTANSLAAQSIRVGAGADVSNIVFAMQAAPAFRVSGTVVDEEGQPVAGAMVRLMEDANTDVMFMGAADTATTRDNGRFTIEEVTPGTYQARAVIPITVGNTTTAVWSTSDSGGLSRSGAGVSGLAVSVSDGAGGGTFTAVGDVTPPMNVDQPSEVIVVDADVTDLRVVARRPTPR